VHAAIKIMQQLQAHNHAANTAESLMIRIGLNAGEPIEEDNDYFGASVQTAARVCAAAGSNAIFCAGVVKDLTHGRGFTYFDQGEFRLKGVPETVRLYEVASMAQASPSQPSLSSAVEKVHYQAPHAAPQNSTPAAARQEAQKPALKARPGARPKPRQAP
jgi:adenylate cyclase